MDAWARGSAARPELDTEADDALLARRGYHAMTRSNVLPSLVRRAAAAAMLLVPPAALLLAGCDHVHHTTQPGQVPPLRAVVLLSPKHDTLAIGAHVQLIAVGVDSASGDTLANLALTWTSRDPSVATVSTSGVVTGVSEGNVRIVVSGSGKADSAFLFVAPAQAGWITILNVPAIEDLHGVFFLSSGRTGWAVGNGGVVMKSSDAGANWSRQVITTFNLEAVWFAGATGYAVGGNGQVFQSTDLGAHWSQLTVPNGVVGHVLRDVVALDANHVWIVGDGGILFGTANGGGTWNVISTGTVTNLNGIAFSGSNAWVVGDQGTILGTRDSGASWYRVPASDVPTASRLSGVARHSQPAALDGTGAIAVGPNGVVLRAATTQDSLAWALANAGTLHQLNAVAWPLGSTAYTAGSNSGQGEVLRTDDGGITWTHQDPHAGVPLNDVWFVDQLRGWAVGNGGVIRHTATGGQ